MKNKMTLFRITELNEKDWVILIILLDNYIGKTKISIGELTKRVEIAPVNMWKHLKKLQEMDLVIIPNVKKGKKKFISFNDGVKMDSRDIKIFMDFTGAVLKDCYSNPEGLKFLQEHKNG